MWNYRVVRKKESPGCSYAIHEAFYDKDGFVFAITQEGVEPFGEDIEELRHSWMMMAEAFGQPVLEYENIPEREYEKGENPLGADDKEAGIPLEDVERELAADLGEWDEEKYRQEKEQERIEKEKTHAEVFVGTETLKELVDKIYSDYKEKEKSDVPD
ncbi:hypothetical protein QUF80_17305 [Desulfococcaceae bacterium HSG8]|nr:hypothetical protein [Desulfococcaceae bacterium HSG8]